MILLNHKMLTTYETILLYEENSLSNHMGTPTYSEDFKMIECNQLCYLSLSLQSNSNQQESGNDPTGSATPQNYDHIHYFIIRLAHCHQTPTLAYHAQNSAHLVHPTDINNSTLHGIECWP